MALRELGSDSDLLDVAAEFRRYIPYNQSAPNLESDRVT